MPPHNRLSKPHYRPEVDGLRAIAVSAVVVFHAFPNALPGGFAGVDVFFVISGFLISSILFDNLQRGSFSFREFYARRIRRIFPALAAVLAASCALGWFLLDPDDYLELGRQVVAGALFVPNLLFWNETGYFDVAAEAKPLLHLWSLGVEEQFYLIWPGLLWWFWRQRWSPRIAVVAIGSMSFIACAWWLTRDAAGAFYSPQTRFWELLCGAALARAHATMSAPTRTPARPLTEVYAWSGALLVIGSFVWLRESVPFPGFAALPCVLGTCLLLHAGPGAWLNRRVLSQRIPVFFGLISYPLYLWHWPLLSIARSAALHPLSVAAVLGLLALSVSLAWMTWRWIETPVRSGDRRRWKVIAPVCAVALMAAIGVVVVATRGAEARVNVDVRRYANFEPDFKQDARGGRCWLSMQSPPASFADECIEPTSAANGPLVLVWGDSHAARLTPGLRAIGRGRFRVAQFTRDGCRPFLTLGYPNCLESNAGIMRTISRLRPEYVVLFSFWTAPAITDERAMLSELERTIAALNAAGVAHVVVIGPSAEWNGRQHALPKNLLRLYREKPFLRAPARTRSGVNPIAARRDALFAAALFGRSDVHYFSAYRAICNADGCMTRAGDDPYDLMTWDYGHLTTSGATYVAQRLQADIGGFHAAPSQRTEKANPKRR